MPLLRWSKVLWETWLSIPQGFLQEQPLPNSQHPGERPVIRNLKNRRWTSLCGCLRVSKSAWGLTGMMGRGKKEQEYSQEICKADYLNLTECWLIYEVIISALFITCFQAFSGGFSIIWEESLHRIRSPKCGSLLPHPQLSKPSPPCLLGHTYSFFYVSFPPLFLSKSLLWNSSPWSCLNMNTGFS